MTDIIYKVFHEGDEILDETATLEGAKKFADEWWAEACQDFGDNVTRTDTVEIFSYNIETDERLATESYEVSDDCYHGDYAEHNTHWGL